jgi:hypothetical protein
MNQVSTLGTPLALRVLTSYQTLGAWDEAISKSENLGGNLVDKIENFLPLMEKEFGDFRGRGGNVRKVVKPVLKIFERLLGAAGEAGNVVNLTFL